MIGRNEKAIGLVLVGGYALMPATSAIEPLRAANLLSGRSLYRTRLFSQEGGWIASSCGGAFETEPLSSATGDLDILFVVAGGDPLAQPGSALLSHLRALSVRGVPLGGISGGAVFLAKAGVMQNRFSITSHSVQPSDYIDVRPVFYAIQSWGESLVKHDLCHQAPVSFILLR